MTKIPSPATASDESDLSRLGYSQSLGRSLGGFSSFAAGFAYISILTGLFQMVPLGYRAAGPVFFWTWPVVALGQMSVALCFAELAGQYPLCGSVYQWAKNVGSDGWGWIAGWVSLAGSIAALAAVSMALQAALPAISSAFQLVGDASEPVDAAHNAVILACVLIAATTALNARGVSLMAAFNNVGVMAEIVGAVLLIALFFGKARHAPTVVMSTTRPLGPGAFLAAGLTASYVLYGFETAGSLAEETVSPRTKSPRAILWAIGSASVLGLLLILSGLMAARDPLDPALGRPDGGLARIATDALGPGVGGVFLGVVAVAIASCALAVQTGAVRLMFAMARDGLLPGSRSLSKVDASTRTPIGPALVVGLLAVVLLLLNANHPSVVEAIGSVSVVWINLAYLLVTIPLLVARFRGWPRGSDDDSSPRFRLGRWGMPLNAVAVTWGIAIVVNTGWPRPEVYGMGFPGRWLAPVGSLALLASGLLYYHVAGRVARQERA